MGRNELRSLTLAALMVVLTAACSGGSATGDRARDAWSTRLTQEAAFVQRQQADAAAARDAWAQRLQALGDAYAQDQARARRADQAWSDRLTNLAPQYAGR